MSKIVYLTQDSKRQSPKVTVVESKRTNSQKASTTSQAKSKPQRRRRRRARGNTTSNGPMLQTVTAPVIQNSAVSNNYWRIQGIPQKAEMGSKGSAVRICGRGGADRLNALTQIGNAYGTTNADQGALVNSSTTYKTWAAFTPAVMFKTFGFAQSFQWYAFREVTVHYSPIVGTTTNAQVTFAIHDNFESTVDTSTANATSSNLLNFDYAIQTPVWQPASFTYRYDGVKVWNTQASEDDSNMKNQLAVGARIVAFTNWGSTGLIVGNLYFEYVLDLYQADPPLGQVSREKDLGDAYFKFMEEAYEKGLTLTELKSQKEKKEKEKELEEFKLVVEDYGMHVTSSKPTQKREEVDEKSAKSTSNSYVKVSVQTPTQRKQ